MHFFNPVPVLKLVEATREEDAPFVNWGGIVVGVLVGGACFLARNVHRQRL